MKREVQAERGVYLYIIYNKAGGNSKWFFEGFGVGSRQLCAPCLFGAAVEGGV